MKPSTINTIYVVSIYWKIKSMYPTYTMINRMTALHSVFWSSIIDVEFLNIINEFKGNNKNVIAY